MPTTTKPISYSLSMMLANLEGRKTQTRRAFGLEKINNLADETSKDWRFTHRSADGLYWFVRETKSTIERQSIKCPYSFDYLWAQENYVINKLRDTDIVTGRYEANNDEFEVQLARHELVKFRNREYPFRSTPARFMYRSLSRFTNKVINIRPERLQDISEQDAVAEGLPVFNEDGNLWYSGLTTDKDSWFNDPMLWVCNTPVEAYKDLWDSINGKNLPWEINPMVWVIESEPFNHNIDRVLAMNAGEQ